MIEILAPSPLVPTRPRCKIFHHGRYQHYGITISIFGLGYLFCRPSGHGAHLKMG
jgi:hypothetical protein